MMHVGDTMSTSGGYHDTCEGYHEYIGGYHEYVLHVSSTSGLSCSRVNVLGLLLVQCTPDNTIKSWDQCTPCNLCVSNQTMIKFNRITL